MHKLWEQKRSTIWSPTCSAPADWRNGDLNKPYQDIHMRWANSVLVRWCLKCFVYAMWDCRGGVQYFALTFEAYWYNSAILEILPCNGEVGLQVRLVHILGQLQVLGHLQMIPHIE